MKYLDDRITFTFNSNLTTHDAGMYVYEVHRDGNAIFVGNFYYNGTDTAYTFDVSDIVRSDGWVVREDDFNGSSNTIQNKLLSVYNVRIVWDSGSTQDSSTEQVAKVYMYENKTLGSIPFFNPALPTARNWVRVALQGYSNSSVEDSSLVPHYPLFSDSQDMEYCECPFGLTFIVGGNVSGISMTYGFDSYSRNFTITPSGNTFAYTNTAGDVGYYNGAIPMSDGVLRAGGVKVAVFDVCPKRYYLFWQDRYGSFQCQAFNDNAKYSETFNRTEVVDYQDRRRNALINVQPKWQLNSGWIPEKLYPYYESIYTSPILILYDCERNMNFSVMVSGDYEEKTYKNQKKMINMNLELQENKKQNIIY